MEQIIEKKTSTDFNCPYACSEYGQEIRYWKHMLPETDDILERAVNISVGVVDKGLGAGFGINITSADEEIDGVAERIRRIMKEI